MEESFKCNLCHDSRYRFIPFRYLFRGRHIQAARCGGCGLIALHPRPSDEEIMAMYAEAYFTEEDVQTHHHDTDYLSAVQQIDYTSKAIELGVHLPAGGGSVLEVGCATGELLNALQQAGHHVAGVEISKFAAGVATEKYGLKVVNAPFEARFVEGELEEGSFDLILMGDVLEHMTDPSAAMRLSLNLLKPGGKLIVKVPSTLNLISSRLAFMVYRIIGSQKTMTIPPYHLFEFFPATLKRIFMDNGFARCKIIQETKHPRSITLRHSKLENLAKVMMQYPNYWLTNGFGVFGDRLTAIGTKRG